MNAEFFWLWVRAVSLLPDELPVLLPEELELSAVLSESLPPALESELLLEEAIAIRLVYKAPSREDAFETEAALLVTSARFPRASVAVAFPEYAASFTGSTRSASVN